MVELASETHEFLTVRELADLLRIKERKVYDLAASGEVPCSRATGKLLFPAEEIRAWIDGAKSGGSVPAVDRPLIFLGSHDPLLDWTLRQSRSGIATYFDGSHDGLARFSEGEGIAAGMHIYDAPSSSWNRIAAASLAGAENAVLVQFARRSRGIVFRQDGPDVLRIADLKDLRIVPRQPESGTAQLFTSLIAEAGLDPAALNLTDVARTEDDAVQMVRQGDADATFGLLSVAEIHGLGFLPVIKESFDLLIERKAWFDPPMQRFLDFCQTDAFTQRAAAQPGYDVEGLGRVVWNA